jgi:IgGFc binding protein/Secretion system C-terminal sorting domain
MRTANSLNNLVGIILYLLFGQEVVAQNIDFSSNSFISFTSGRAIGMTFCADSASFIHINDENSVLLSSFYLPGPGCIDILYDSSILSNTNYQWQLDKNRLYIQSDVKGVIYHTSSQLLYAQIPAPGVTPYPNNYSMELFPPTSMAGTANIKLGYNLTCETSIFPFSVQTFGYHFQLLGIQDTSRLHMYPGGYHPLLNGQNSYPISIAEDELWLDHFEVSSFTTIFPQYYPSSLVEQDSSTYSNGKFISYAGVELQNICLSNPWAYYNARILFFPLAYEFLGTSYHTIPHASRLGDSLMAFSFHDGTILNVNGTIDTLDKGEIYRTLIDTPATWTANHPFSLVQISRQSAQDSVFQSAMFAYSVHPDEALLTYTWYPSEIIDDTIPNQQSYLNLLSPSNGLNTVKLDGNSLASFFQPYANDSTWSWAQIPVASSLHKLEADSGVVAYAYQYGESCGAGFNVGGLRMKNSVTTAQPEVETTTGFNLYPNPASDFVNLTQIKSAQENLHLSVWSMDGRMLLEETLIRPPYRLNIAALPAGMYLLKVDSSVKNKNQTLRFIKLD